MRVCAQRARALSGNAALRWERGLALRYQVITNPAPQPHGAAGLAPRPDIANRFNVCNLMKLPTGAFEKEVKSKRALGASLIGSCAIFIC